MYSMDLMQLSLLVSPLIASLLLPKLFTVLCFLDGQTGSGKTYTMGLSDMQHGVLPYALEDIITVKNELLSRGVRVEVQYSCVEIYMEECFDLLSKNKEIEKKKVDLRERSNGETFLEGLTTVPVTTFKRLVKQLEDGIKSRCVGKTSMNARSSRSHVISTFYVKVYHGKGAVASKLHLVDLAGSERPEKAKTKGKSFKEGVSINKSLLVLGNVVSALSANKKHSIEKSNSLVDSKELPATPNTLRSSARLNACFAPYRESKLTFFLKDSFGGNSMTVLLACISPVGQHLEESIATLDFAARAACVVNSAKINLTEEKDSRAELLKQLNEMRREMSSMKQEYEVLKMSCDLRSSMDGPYAFDVRGSTGARLSDLLPPPNQQQDHSRDLIIASLEAKVDALVKENLNLEEKYDTIKSQREEEIGIWSYERSQLQQDYRFIKSQLRFSEGLRETAEKALKEQREKSQADKVESTSIQLEEKEKIVNDLQQLVIVLQRQLEELAERAAKNENFNPNISGTAANFSHKDEEQHRNDGSRINEKSMLVSYMSNKKKVAKSERKIGKFLRGKKMKKLKSMFLCSSSLDDVIQLDCPTSLDSTDNVPYVSRNLAEQEPSQPLELIDIDADLKAIKRQHGSLLLAPIIEEDYEYGKASISEGGNKYLAVESNSSKSIGEKKNRSDSVVRRRSTGGGVTEWEAKVVDEIEMDTSTKDFVTIY